MKISLKFYFILLFVLNYSFVIAQTKDEEAAFVDSLLSEMTLSEKIGQLVELVGGSSVNDGMLRNGMVSSILGIKDAEAANKLQKTAVEESRLGIPLLFTNDVIHGYNTTFPIPLAEASSWNPDLVEEACRIAAVEAASNGTHLTFAPMVDIARDPRWGRIAEGSGEDVYLGSVMAEARVKGFQGDNLKSRTSIGACAKHYVAYGAAEAGKDYNTVDISERSLREIYLPPFRAAVDAGVVSIMSAFNDLNGIPASANYFTLTEILRNEWKFDGFVISDYNSISELINHRIAKNGA
jgi:beta-glucosidase